jgi:hypothetical protein
MIKRKRSKEAFDQLDVQNLRRVWAKRKKG